MVELERSVGELGVSASEQEVLLAVPTLSGGREVIDRAVELDGDRVGAASRVCARSRTASPNAASSTA